MDIDDCDINVKLVKNVLNREKIKLWLPPYILENGVISEPDIEELTNRLSKVLNVDSRTIGECVRALQETSVENLKERNAFQETGIAVIKIRSPSGGGEPVAVNIKLNENGNALKVLISQKIGEQLERLKLIHKGKVLQDNQSLESQRVTHGAKVMALVLHKNSEDLKTFEENNATVDATKRDIETLTDSITPEGDLYLQITDQSGNPISLPPAEQKSLVTAMALHEKGRAALKSENYNLALFLFLEAEKEFSQCTSKLLENVDNYGLLSLDIAWCYLCLQSLVQLPDADARLQRCEKVFHKSYGPDLERLIALKGDAGKEGALFLRLHLLQAIIRFHQGRLEEARVLLSRVEEELKGLKVDDEQLSQLVDLGYKLGEARLALRESKGNTSIAVSIIENRRAERIKKDNDAKKKREENKIRTKLGKCLNGSWVEPQFHKSLMSMGYSFETAKWALAETNNSIAGAVSIIQEHPNRLPSVAISDDLVQQVASLGFDIQAATAALKKSSGNVDQAVEELVVNNGQILVDDVNEIATSNNPEPSCSSDPPKTKRRKNSEEQETAFSRISEGIVNTDEDYLDLALNAEEEFLKKYKSLLTLP